MKRKIHLVIEASDFEIRAAKDCASRNGDQHDAYSIAAWLARADRDGKD